jgi:hypothetical protein
VSLRRLSLILVLIYLAASAPCIEAQEAAPRTTPARVRNIPHIFEVYEGGDHGNKIRQRLETRVFQFFSERLDFGDTK